MLKWLFSLLFLILFSLAQADDKVKHNWLTLVSGGWERASVYIDLFSINKIDVHTWEFLGSTAPAIKDAIVNFEDSAGKTIALSRPAFVVFYYTRVNCITESLVTFKTDYYDEQGKLILSHKINPNQNIPVKPGYDTTVMFKYICHKKPSKRTDA
jgi:hypothetical protein